MQEALAMFDRFPEQSEIHAEYRFQFKDDGYHWIQDAACVIRDAEGSPVEIVGTFTDITARKQVEMALRRSEAQLHALAARLQAVREEERTSIAREVHDVLGQLLTGLSMDMAWLEKRLSKVADPALRQTMIDKLAEVQRLIDAMIRTVQEISSELRPSVLDNLGLDSAIRFEVNRFWQRTNIACTVEPPDAMPPLDVERATGAFRIFQEILSNIARHAQATQVSIHLAATADSLMLEVRDNGRGITPEQVAGANSLGLLSMRERAAQLGGHIDLAGEPGRGTTVTVTMPL
jgi:signal transduction histidine kinase